MDRQDQVTPTPPLDLRDQLQASLGSAYSIERELGGGGMLRRDWLA